MRGQYRSTASALSDKETSTPSVNERGELVTASGELGAGEDYDNNVQHVVVVPLNSTATTGILYTSFGSVVTNAIAVPVTATLYSAIVSNDNAAARYILFFDSTSAPAAAAVPMLSLLIPPTSERVVGPEVFGNGGHRFDNGITWAVSSTRASFTAASASEHTVQLRFQL